MYIEGHVCTKPTKHEVCSKNFVVAFGFILFFFVCCKSFLTRTGRSIAPRDVVQVAYGVNLEQICKSGYHSDIRDEANYIFGEVHDEVHWAHCHRH